MCSKFGAGRTIYGDYCQCDTDACQKGSNGLPCGGKEQGECKCECKEGWKRDACECSTDQSTCHKPEELGITGFKYFVLAQISIRIEIRLLQFLERTIRGPINRHPYFCDFSENVC